METCAKLRQGLLCKCKRKEVGVRWLSQYRKKVYFLYYQCKCNMPREIGRCDQLGVSLHSTRRLNISPDPLSSKSGVNSTVRQPQRIQQIGSLIKYATEWAIEFHCLCWQVKDRRHNFLGFYLRCILNVSSTKSVPGCINFYKIFCCCYAQLEAEWKQVKSQEWHHATRTNTQWLD